MPQRTSSSHPPKYPHWGVFCLLLAGSLCSAEGEHRVPDYSYNVERMQVCMRKKGYLCHPELEDNLTSLSGKLLDENLLNLKTISRERRQENVLKVMQSNDFVISLNSRRIDIIKDQSTIPENDYDEQAKIMISSEINPEVQASLFQYWQNVAKDKFDQHNPLNVN